MLVRDTKHYGVVEVCADTEVIYETCDGMSTIIPYSDNWDKVLVQVSGGLDSGLMLFLIVKTLKEKNSKAKVVPISFEVPTKAKNLESARAIISKVKSLLGSELFLDSLEVHIPIEHCDIDRKDAFFKDTLFKIKQELGISFEFNGNTKNPPEGIRRDFRDDQDRQFGRDDRKSIYNAPKSASPHALVTKKGIVYLYKKLNILNELAPLTLSCDMDITEIKERNLPVPCGECWWCRERQWGFDSNNEIDPAIQLKIK